MARLDSGIRMRRLSLSDGLVGTICELIFAWSKRALTTI